MEQPYKGRAIINEVFNGLEITIPAKRQWFFIIFIGAWLCGWLIGELTAIGFLFGEFFKNLGGIFILGWLCLWTVGGFVAIRTFLWNLIGKEIITVGQGQLTIQRKGDIFAKPKTYDIYDVKNIRVQEDAFLYGGLFARRNDFGGLNAGGTIRFDYGFKTIKFGTGIDEAEGYFIVDKMKNYGISYRREDSFKLN